MTFVTTQNIKQDYNKSINKKERKKKEENKMTKYEKEFVEYVNEATNRKYENMDDICACEYSDDIEMFMDDFCYEKGYDFFEVSREL